MSLLIRSLDNTGDWNFGNGLSDYLTRNAAVAQSIKTRVSSFLGNCFFAVNDGIDWFNLLTKNNQTQINLSVSACILNCPNGVVTGIQQLSVNVSTQRNINIQYRVQTVYSVQGVQGNFQYALGTTG